MAAILHKFNIEVPASVVFKGITTPQGLNCWWTKKCKGNHILGTVYQLYFGEQYQWQAIVTKSKPDQIFEMQLAESNDEWKGTKVGFLLTENNKITAVSFYHKGWQEKSENFKFSSYCWAMYLRILKRNLEHGEKVPYEKRLHV